MREDIQIHSVDCSEYMCVICLQVFYKPIITQCGHNFCGKCISEWMQKKKQCPYCRKEYQNYNFYQKDEVMTLKLEHLEVSCLKCDKWFGQLKDLKSHRQSQCTSPKQTDQLHETLVIQDDPEDLVQTIFNEINSIKKQQNYNSLLNIENEYMELLKVHPNDQMIRKKIKIDYNDDQIQEQPDVLELEQEEICIFKHSQKYILKQCKKRLECQNKFLKEIMEGQYRIETKEFFYQVLGYRNYIVSHHQFQLI
ncbi:unnamed protein product (macronuclear) [Paramecium tetraurelia]|uniref:RING-type domain-containing protein n=1 Tax=Paramecium tetraurelia TaxID=5888 RepID=A0CPP5_PARTE|nr:uncharacterized protein GSPATT00009154001 [Paramecium tetraurelia]CAK72762.1 unnamed protein product [Paramecium tetraurelia]|eukprot:XP_001440159.1 hypothetical protein (macronuclear) [Paramecium tetraurelia strain d4-2]